MNSSTLESRSEAIDVKGFAKRRMLHVILPLFIVSIIAFLDRVNIAYAGLTMKENLPWLTPEVFGMGAGIFFIGYVLFEVPASLIAARCNAMLWIARIMFSWGIVCVLMTTMTTVWEFYLYRFLLGLCEASLYPVVYSLLIPNWFLPKERAKAISLMLTSLLFSNIIGGPLAGVLLDTTFFWLTWVAYTLHRRGVTCSNFCFHFCILDERKTRTSFLGKRCRESLHERRIS